jgi:catalase
MPLPTDPHTLEVSRDLLHALDDLNGVHPGFRAAHSKGILLSGTFTPTAEARTLTRAPHAQRTSTPVWVRFSNSAGFPEVADNDPKSASPRGMAIRFQLAEHVHTDVIGVSTDGFPVRTPEEFVQFLRAAHASGPDAPKPTAIEAFLGTHPKALKFVTTPKPIPTSFARENFFGVNAFKFTNPAGDTRYVRYRTKPVLGTEYVDEKEVASNPPNFLFDDIEDRIAQGPVEFEMFVQLAESGDVVDDATVLWGNDRKEVKFGAIVLTAVVADNAGEQKKIIFDPIPRVEGIEPSGDPLLEARAGVYLMSGRRRREE